MVRLNPDRPAPAEVVEEIISVTVRYFDSVGDAKKGIIEVHKDVVRDVQGFFELAYKIGFPIERVVRSSDPEFGWDDDKLMAANATSGFNYRLIKGTDRPSLHGLGRAIDVNTRLNPYMRHAHGDVEIDPPRASWNPEVPGTLTADHPLVRFMKDRGWEWGGNWTPESGRTDYQHFEKKE